MEPQLRLTIVKYRYNLIFPFIYFAQIRCLFIHNFLFIMFVYFGIRQGMHVCMSLISIRMMKYKLYQYSYFDANEEMSSMTIIIH